MAGVTVKRIEEMEHAYGGAFVRARASLGVRAFGLNVIQLPPDSGDAAPEHDHAADGQEEVYVLLGGSCDLAVGERTIALDAETFVRVAPDVRRRLRSGADGARVLVIGGVPAAAYEPPPNSELGGPEILLPGASSSVFA
jgi:quercetin dioxygenase-like cupin family protein